MSRSRPPSDAYISKVLKAAVAAGLRVTGFKVDVHTGKIEIETGKSERQDSNPLDTWMAKHHARETEGH
jgi:hypothetical protein